MKRKGVASMDEHFIASNVDLILASASPRREDLLRGIGVRFLAMPSSVDETVIDGEPPEVHVCRLALAKAKEVSKRVGAWVLGADTVVVIDGRILGKPLDQKEAQGMLSALASRTHVVFTGYAIVNSRFPDRERVRFVRSEVRIRGMTPAEIAGYVMTGEPMDKAGAYAIQGIGAAIVECVFGSYTSVVGLPLCEVARDLKELGIFDMLAENHGHDCPESD